MSVPGDKNRAATKRPSSERGFTLLETLVALTILALSVTTLFGIFSQSLSRTRQDMREMQARTLAQSLLEGARATPPQTDAQGIDASGLSWQLQVRPLGDESPLSTALQAETVAATVRWPEAGEEKRLTLATLVFAPKKALP